jgi:hypothetical protein
MLVREPVRGSGGYLMRGRNPSPVDLKPNDRLVLQQIAHSDSLPWYPVRRARIVLGLAAGESVQTLAAHLQCDPATVWRTHQRDRQSGLPGLRADARSGHSGRLIRISPPPARPNHPTGLPGTDRQGVAPHPLVQRRLGPPGGPRRHCRIHQRPHRVPHLAGGRSATASQALLEDSPAERRVHGARRKDFVVLQLCRSLGPTRLRGGLCRRIAQLPSAGTSAHPASYPWLDRAAGV